MLSEELWIIVVRLLIELWAGGGGGVKISLSLGAIFTWDGVFRSG